LCICTAIFAWLFKKHPVEKTDHAEAMAAELRARREAADEEMKA
jgi:hypothetical protein